MLNEVFCVPEIDDWVIFGLFGLVTQSRIDSTAIGSARRLPGGWPDASQVCLGITGPKCGSMAPSTAQQPRCRPLASRK
jgi:hypothetical protein